MLELSLAEDVAEIARAATAVDAFCEQNGLSPQLAFDLNLAIDELATNTISYGFSDKATVGDIHLRIAVVDGEWIEVRLDDNGSPYDPFTQAPPPVLDASIEDRPIGGFGVYFVRELMDDVDYRRENGRNHITLRRRIHRNAPTTGR